MPRVRPINRIDDLARVAAETFIRCGGFGRTQISDVARALGVAKGTLYLYVESKEALFDLALEHADSREPVSEPAALPIPTPAPTETARKVRRRLELGSELPRLTRACATTTSEPATLELGEIIGELFDVMVANRITIRLLTVCAAESPELAAEWYGRGRRRLVSRLAGYLESRAATGALAGSPTPTVAARMIIETISFLAVHHHYNPVPQAIDDSDARAEAVRSLARAYAPPCAPRPALNK